MKKYNFDITNGCKPSYSLAEQYYPFFYELLDKPHILIAGSTGSGKSVLLNTIMWSALIDTPNKKTFCFIDPKRVELQDYMNLPHCAAYVSDNDDIIYALKKSIEIMESRYKYMERKGIKKFDGSDYYIVIDEFADLMVSDKAKEFKRLIQKIAQIGRACSVHLILSTQSPSRKTLESSITLNITERIALHCQSAIESKQIIGIAGAENLPRYGSFLYSSPDGLYKGIVPMVSDEQIKERVKKWL